jgi:hypothetical protein
LHRLNTRSGTSREKAQETQRAKAATEWKKTESWQHRIMQSKDEIFAWRSTKGGAA